MTRAFGVSLCSLVAIAGAASLAGRAEALTMQNLADAGLEDSFGRYAAGGDCSKGPVIVIDASGFSYEVTGRTTHPARFEMAYSFFGNQYDGIQIAVFPFMKSDDNYGASFMTLNADEVEGKITFEISDPPGSATEKALAQGSPYLRCGPPPPRRAVAEAPPPPPALPLDFATLPRIAGSFDTPYDMFGKGEVAEALRALIGSRMDALEENLSVTGPIAREGSIYYVSGNAPHLGGEEQAYVLIDAARKRVQVGLWQKGKLTVYAPSQGRMPLPAALHQLLLQSPPETAVPLPGTPWEVITTSDSVPLATVDAAGSPDIESFSLFCDQGRPKIAMLTNKPRRGAVTATWNFSGRTIDIPLGQGNAEGAFWLGWLDSSPLVAMLAAQSGFAYLRINGELQGQASLAGSTAALRTALNGCARV